MHARRPASNVLGQPPTAQEQMALAFPGANLRVESELYAEWRQSRWVSEAGSDETDHR